MIKPELEYGTGKESVYVYYFPSTATNKNKWPCKIGRAKNGVKKRLSGQKAGMLEPPVIGLIIHTDDCLRDEMIIHTLMRKDKIENSFGNEWYETTPRGVLNTYIDADEMLTLGQQIRIARRRQGMSQSELGKAAGLRQETISNIENGYNIQLNSILECLRELKLRIKLLDNNDDAPNHGVGLFDRG